MAEEINYASVVFLNKTNTRREAQKEEEIVYDEVKVPQKKAEQAADDQKATNGHRHYQVKACCLGIFCVILLSGITVSVYFTSVISENNNKLTAKNQQLEREKNILTEQIRNLENNVTVAQQIIDAYCPKKDENRQCCLKGWEYHQSSCYVINKPEENNQKTWEEAQEDCRGNNSDLAVIVNEDEKTFISGKSWGSSGDKGYWIGLRAEAEEWKWIDGSDLAEKSWMTQPANNGYCAISVPNQEWKSASCGNKNCWICKKAALSV